MWRFWFFFGILKISFAAPVETSQDDIVPTSDIAALKCLLSSHVNLCDDAKRSAEKIPKRLQKLYEKFKWPLLNTTTNELLDSASLETLPASLLYLIPKVHLTSMKGFTASEIVRRFPFDDALTMKLLGLFKNKITIINFLTGLQNPEEVVGDSFEKRTMNTVTVISPAVEKEIALSLSRWFSDGSKWDYSLFEPAMSTGSPMLASLPNYFLNSLSLQNSEKFLFHFNNWKWEDSKEYKSSWDQHSMSVKRIWSSIILNKLEPPSKWTPRKLRRFGVFLIGATPDELRKLPTELRIVRDFTSIFNLNWSALQARAMFDVGFSGLKELTEFNLDNTKNVIVYLLPRQILQFSHNVTDFSFIKSTNAISIPTEKQLFSSHLALLISKNKSKEFSPTFWKDHMENAGKFYHLLPASTFETFLNDSLDLDILSRADSERLSFRQAHYLTNSGKVINITEPDTVLRFKGLIKSVPSSELARVPSNTISHRVKEHLLVFSYGESLPFMALLLKDVKHDLEQTSYLEKMLYNKDYKEYFKLLPSRDIRHKFKHISSNLFDIAKRNSVLERNIRLLPPNTLSALLSHHRREVIKTDGGWNFENLVESDVKLYLSGFSCIDIEMLDIFDFMPVIGYYVHQRRAMNEMFPKNMQYCSQKALTEYLKMKAPFRVFRYEHYALLNLLELHEVRAVGGYILAGLPIDVINALNIKYQIITEIGKLSIPELMTATSLKNVKEFADIYVSYNNNSQNYDLKVISGLGNLVWFLDEDQIHKLKPSDFKLHLESMEENSMKALCLDQQERDEWKRLIIRSFGKSDSWSSGTLSYLGDLLFVFDGYELERVNKSSWIEAADVLTKTTSFYKLLEWPGKSKPIYMFEACLEVLSVSEKTQYKSAVKQLLRYYLESAQHLLETVQTAQSILKIQEEPNLIENAQYVGASVISTIFGSHLSVQLTGEEDVKVSKILSDKTIENDSSSNDDDEYDSKEDYNDSAVKSYKSHDKDSSTSEKVPETTEIATNEETVESTSKHPVTSHSEELFTRKQESAHSRALLNNNSKLSNSFPDENDLYENEDGILIPPKNSKSPEEIKEELQRNASRALIVEVPLNRSELSFDTKHHMKISCNAIRMLGKPASLILDVKDLEQLNDTELEDCSEVLGALELDSEIKNYVWRKLKKWKVSGNLMEVGSLVSAIKEDDILKISLRLSEPWTLENLHLLSKHVKDPELMSFITDQFLLNNPNLHALNYESAISLGSLVCTMTLSRQKKYFLSHPDVFVNVVKNLGNSLDCSTTVFQSCIQQLASIATSPEAFGETSKWDANDVADLGVIVAGLVKSHWQQKNGKGLKPEAFAGLTPTAASCIPSEVLQVLSEEQLLKIPTLSAAAISTEQSSNLSPSQYKIIDRVKRQVPPKDLTSSITSNAYHTKPSLSSTVTVTLFVSVFVTSRTFYYL